MAEELNDYKRRVVDSLVARGWATSTGDMTVCQAHEVAETVVKQFVAPLLWLHAEAMWQRDGLKAAIADIDAHATPVGWLHNDDPEGSPHHYLLTVGALHRALGKAYTAESCESERARLRVEVSRLRREVEFEANAEPFNHDWMSFGIRPCACLPAGFEVPAGWSVPQCAVHPEGTAEPRWVRPAPECPTQNHAHYPHGLPLPDGGSVSCPGQGVYPPAVGAAHPEGQGEIRAVPWNEKDAAAFEAEVRAAESGDA